VSSLPTKPCKCGGKWGKDFTFWPKLGADYAETGFYIGRNIDVKVSLGHYQCEHCGAGWWKEKDSEWADGLEKAIRKAVTAYRKKGK